MHACLFFASFFCCEGDAVMFGVHCGRCLLLDSGANLCRHFCSWERSQAVEDKYLGLFLLLCCREVSNLPYPTLCASSLSSYMFCFRSLKLKHQTT
ncbi:hypothetical protein CY35_12G007000 [Sphagnum magellanicum]|nr:hypothetical protein CY35_12G007000 [Sphagnum magellanicum]